MKFQFPGTPYDGIPFDRVSEQEIRAYQYQKRTMVCNFCCEMVKVNIDNVVSIYEIMPQVDENTRWTSMYNVSMSENDGTEMIECPLCSMVHSINQVWI
jgi:hypothetical protein